MRRPVDPRKNSADGPRKDDLTLPPDSTPPVLDTSGMPPPIAAGALEHAELIIAQARELPICPTCGIHPIEVVRLYEELRDLVGEIREYRRVLAEALERTTAAPAGYPLMVRCEACGEEIGTSVVPGYCIRCRP